ncbi:MAG: bifunctional 4-hydroxy-2-oxoglutarate aldolase/2-dehydro-3-deoxy-phosphogluconate aldolase [Lachnospiraceae bacterium]|nr:bifunctional 4-hydroxy-2-oxoglutarate aldolase/2-dehydro-3-deoxy-phosphogluconate aldolase [Lachnospiraceae bacterium]
MNVLERLEKAGIIPAAVIEDEKDAVPTAKALLAGGIDTVEVTFRTKAAAQSIREISIHCPEVLVGAGTVITLEQCKKAVECGAKYIVSPGYNDEVVAWCVENDITVLPGCLSPTEITLAVKRGLKVVKFFPAGCFGGIKTMKALSGPFGEVKFVPTGGVNGENVGEYYQQPFIYAVGGSWVCTKKDISENNFDRISELSKQAKESIKGLKK